MTRSEFFQKLTLLEERSPGEVLLPSLRKGFCPVNVAYMKMAMARMPEEETPDPPLDDEGEYNGPIDDSDLQDLWKERGRLFLEMNKTSNLFHDCKSDDERRVISRQIRRIWDDICRVKSKIAYFETHGAVPDENDERFPLPEDPVALVKKLNSIRASISQAQKRLEVFGALPDGHPDRRKISETEAKLAELKLYKGHAENAVARASVHAG